MSDTHGDESLATAAEPDDDTAPPPTAQRPDDEVPPVTDRRHDNTWSANLELEMHADDRVLVVEQAIEAVEMTDPGYHVNLVSHAAHGHPSTYLVDALETAFGDEVSVEYIKQCGCGGHVTRAYVQQES